MLVNPFAIDDANMCPLFHCLNNDMLAEKWLMMQMESMVWYFILYVIHK